MDEEILVRGKATGLKTVPTILIALGLIAGVGLYLARLKDEYGMSIFTFFSGVFFLVVGIVLLIYVNSCLICVTNKRIYGKAAFGAKVSIPIDSVTAVGTIALFKGISVGSSSGKIKFLYISNADEIYFKINSLLNERQSNKQQ